MPKTLRALAVALPVLLTSALLTPTASAGVLDVTCTPPSSDVATYNPPLTATNQATRVTASTQYGPCVSASLPGLTSGSRSFQGNAVTSCLNLLGSRAGTLVITWNTGQSSTINGNAITTIAGATFNQVFTGTVTSGLFSGDTVAQTLTAPATDITLCTLGLGTVSSVYSTVSLEITSL
ncbi:hypothetical protein ACIGNX_01310 [Actinosynnema sp. NPDC053489]|uniref:hypothetical protein n=1 Tax=Actinosynnema sp. NPDC053489 TaxID=3363916 RepID=UPI0037CB967F